MGSISHPSDIAKMVESALNRNQSHKNDALEFFNYSTTSQNFGLFNDLSKLTYRQTKWAYVYLHRKFKDGYHVYQGQDLPARDDYLPIPLDNIPLAELKNKLKETLDDLRFDYDGLESLLENEIDKYLVPDSNIKFILTSKRRLMNAIKFMQQVFLIHDVENHTADDVCFDLKNSFTDILDLTFVRNKSLEPSRYRDRTRNKYLFYISTKIFLVNYFIVFINRLELNDNSLIEWIDPKNEKQLDWIINYFNDRKDSNSRLAFNFKYPMLSLEEKHLHIVSILDNFDPIIPVKDYAFKNDMDNSYYRRLIKDIFDYTSSEDKIKFINRMKSSWSRKDDRANDSKVREQDKPIKKVT